MRLIILLLLCLPAFSQTLLSGVLGSNGGSAGTVATPTDSPGAGSYGSTQSVTLSDATGSAVICYTIDGSTPGAATPGTCDSSPTTTYSGAISVGSTTTVKAIGTKAGMTNSGVLSSVYTISGGAASGWTARFKANVNTDLYTVLGPPPTTHPSNGNQIVAWLDSTTLDFSWTQPIGSSAPTWNSTGLSGVGALESPGSATRYYNLNNRAITSSVPMSGLVSNTAFSIWLDFSINANATNTGTVYTETAIFAGAGGYIGIYFKTIGGTTSVCAYNYAGAYNSALCKTVTQSTRHVVNVRHESGNLVIALDNTGESSTASGTTTAVNDNVYLFSNMGIAVFGAFDVKEMLVYASNSGGEVTTNWTYFGF